MGPNDQNAPPFRKDSCLGEDRLAVLLYLSPSQETSFWLQWLVISQSRLSLLTPLSLRRHLCITLLLDFQLGLMSTVILGTHPVSLNRQASGKKSWCPLTNLLVTNLTRFPIPYSLPTLMSPKQSVDGSYRLNLQVVRHLLWQIQEQMFV